MAGSAVVDLDGQRIRTLKQGAWFGEVALLRDTPRTATVTMASDGELAALERHDFLRAMAFDVAAEEAAAASFADLPGIDRAPRLPSLDERPSLAGRDPAVVLAGVPLLRGAAESELDVLAARVTRVHVAPGETLFSQDDPSEAFFVILEGTLAVNVNGEDVREMGPGDSFGELGLFRSVGRTSTVRALSATILLSVPGDAFLSAVRSTRRDAERD